MTERNYASCNRHGDCAAADAKAKERYLEDQKLPWRERNDALRPYADHCHDDCCEDCFGS
jgi:hypothetical protein